MTTSNSLPYIGSKISLITIAGIRYEGILYNINTKESTVGLANVRTFGSEGRKMGAGEVPAKDDVYDYIVFRGRDIKDITVSEPAPPDDPAIVAITPIPGNPSQNASSQHMDNQMLKNARMGGGGPNYMMSGGGRTGGMGGGPPSMMGLSMDGYSNPIRRDNLGVNNRGAYGSGMMNGREDYRMDDRRGNYGQSSPFMPRRGGYQGGMTNGRGRAGFGPRRIIGELTAQPNQSLKSQVEEAFNFEESNSKFEKGLNPENILEGKENAERNVMTTGTVNVYDKKSSFFDNISCETLDRQAGHDARVERSKQRQLDVETFGQAATAAQARGRGNRMPRRVLNFRRPQTVGLGPAMGNGMGYMNGYPYGPRF